MAGHAYSERFLNLAAAPGTYAYTVPEGRRAIITNFQGLSTGPSGELYLRVAGVVSWGWITAVNNSVKVETLRLVAYEGEIVELIIAQSGMRATITGYLLTVAP